MKTYSYKAVVVDDEEDGRNIIILLLQKLFPEIRVVGDADCVADAIPMIAGKEPDIVFLDVELPDGTGFDILPAIASVRPQVIMITAHDHYALKALKASVLDFLLKPVNAGELKEAVNKALLRYHQVNEHALYFSELLLQIQSKLIIRKIKIPTIHGFTLIDVDTIIRCEASDNYSILLLDNKPRLTVSRTLSDFETELKDYGFVRIHHKHLINAKQVVEYHRGKSGGGYVLMSDKTELEVSVRKKETLLQMFGNRKFLV